MYESWWGVELAPGNQLHPSWVISIRSHIKYIRKVDTHCYVLTTRTPVQWQGAVMVANNN